MYVQSGQCFVVIPYFVCASVRKEIQSVQSQFSRILPSFGLRVLLGKRGNTEIDPTCHSGSSHRDASPLSFSASSGEQSHCRAGPSGVSRPGKELSLYLDFDASKGRMKAVGIPSTDAIDGCNDLII